MKRVTERKRFARIGGFACAIVLASAILVAAPRPASAGGVHLSFGIGVPVYPSYGYAYPSYAYPSYPVYPAYPYPYYSSYYYAPPVVVGGYWGYRGHSYGGGWRGHGGGHWNGGHGGGHWRGGGHRH